jgi:hypothetical protein
MSGILTLRRVLCEHQYKIHAENAMTRACSTAASARNALFLSHMIFAISRFTNSLQHEHSNSSSQGGQITQSRSLHARNTKPTGQ